MIIISLQPLGGEVGRGLMFSSTFSNNNTEDKNYWKKTDFLTQSCKHVRPSSNYVTERLLALHQYPTSGPSASPPHSCEITTRKVNLKNLH